MVYKRCYTGLVRTIVFCLVPDNEDNNHDSQLEKLARQFSSGYTFRCLCGFLADSAQEMEFHISECDRNKVM